MATFTITTLNDSGDNLTVDGTLADEIADGGGLSLREAIILANDNGVGDVITFDAGLSGGTVYLTGTNPLAITSSMIVNGDLNNDDLPDITISGDSGRNDSLRLDPRGNLVTAAQSNAFGADNTSLFRIDAAPVTLDGLVMTGGVAAVRAGMYVAPGASVTILNSSLSGNISEFGAGALFSRGTVTIRNTVLMENVAENNYNGDGGAINNHGTLTISDSVFAYNHAQNHGGAIANTFVGSVSVEDSSFYGNTATDGGAFYSRSTSDFTNVTFTGNSSRFGGGAIYTREPGQDMTLTNVTMTGNHAGSVGGAIRNQGGDVVLSNSLVVGNNSSGTIRTSDIFHGAVTLSGRNLVNQDAAGVFASTVQIDPDGVAGSGDEFLAGRLELIGGPVGTVALNRDAANPALDAGDDLVAPLTDARGFARVVDLPGIPNAGGASDLGAYEAQQTAPDARDDAVSGDADRVLSGNLIVDNGSGADRDPDGDAISVTEVGGNRLAIGVELLLLSGALLRVNADGSFTYDPNGRFDGLADGETATETFRYTLGDAFGGSDEATVTVTLNGVDDPPVATDDAITTAEDQTVTIPVLANDRDPEGASLAVVTIDGQAAGLGPVDVGAGVVALNPDGTLDYTPDANVNGQESFSYTLQDDTGGFATATVTVTVTPVNDAPVILSGANFALTEVIDDSAAITSVAASDIEGDALTFSIAGGADQVLFEIDETTGVLGFIAPPDFEQPQDAGGDNSYDVVVGVSDGTDLTTQDITVDVLDFAEIIRDDGRGKLEGTDAAELLDGGEGNDRYTGLGGADIFVLGVGDRDWILDFEDGIVRISMVDWGVTSLADLNFTDRGKSGIVVLTDGNGNTGAVRSNAADFDSSVLQDSTDFLFAG